MDLLLNLFTLTNTNSMTDSKLNSKQLDHLKANYANLIVDGMDMDTLITFAIESIEQNIKDWDENDVKSEILDYYDDETLEGLMEGI